MKCLDQGFDFGAKVGTLKLDGEIRDEIDKELRVEPVRISVQNDPGLQWLRSVHYL